MINLDRCSYRKLHNKYFRPFFLIFVVFIDYHSLPNLLELIQVRTSMIRQLSLFTSYI